MSFRGGNRGGGSWRGGRGGPPPAKKFRAEDDDDNDGGHGGGSTFEAQLASMLDEEDEMMDGPEPSTAMEEPIECHEERFVRWRRPPPPSLDVKKDKLIFQQIDIDHYIGIPMPGMPGARTGVVPIMRMFGINKAVSLYVQAFMLLVLLNEIIYKSYISGP